MQHLMAMIAPFEGGDASRELFFARRVASHSMPHTMMSGQMHGSPVASGYLTPDRKGSQSCIIGCAWKLSTLVYSLNNLGTSRTQST